MVISEVAKRYAAALFDSVGDKNKVPEVLEQLRALEGVFNNNKDISAFLVSPLVAGNEKSKILGEALSKGTLTTDVLNLVKLLAENDRLDEWSGLVNAFQSKADQAHGVVRGLVRSAAPLSPDSRAQIESRVAQVTGKKVILEYKEDASLLGGLIAEVGSLTFDDSLETQLRTMNEELKRRSH